MVTQLADSSVLEAIASSIVSESTQFMERIQLLNQSITEVYMQITVVLQLCDRHHKDKIVLLCIQQTAWSLVLIVFFIHSNM